jgi:hypothetical protein
MIPASLSLWRIRPATINHVLAVLLVGSEFQMFWITASGVVAFMANN